ncbi:thioredoxin domain-containing protein [Streptomyces spongiae]|uniref:Uncharacterized protein n=1 Tax=Streptomyces spongiae TaxID=565072 RepID=A0A5N8XHR0_9ACTN|nr:hypothetical protein [Streptomyces spongiae]MPY58774.1 hypothetical protein [Streptomyces spongiae]
MPDSVCARLRRRGEGLAALRDQPGINDREAAEAVRRAWFVDGGGPSDAEVYQDVADELGPHSDAVTAAYACPTGRVKDHADFRELRTLARRLPIQPHHDLTSLGEPP